MKVTRTTTGKPPKELGNDVTVGPTGNFANISSALLYLTSKVKPDDVTERTIRIASNQIIEDNVKAIFPEAESRVLNVHIECSGTPKAIVRATNDAPVFDVRNANGLKIRGLKIQADGRAVALRFRDRCNVELDDLEISGYRDFGLSGPGLNGRVILNNVQFQKGKAGIQLAGISAGGLRLNGCRFLNSPAGIEVVNSLSDVEIRGCRFHEVQTSISFSGNKTQDVQDLTLMNNTFSGGKTALSFASAPGKNKNWKVVHNLFANLGESELSLGTASSPTESWFKPSGLAQNNWSTTKSGQDNLNPFFENGQRGVTIEFKSSDPSSSDFLKPISDNLKHPPGNPADQAAPYVGAVAP